MARRRTSHSRARARPEARASHAVVYVHGICHHDPGFSAPWFAALRPHLSDPDDFQRLEVLWSDIVHPPQPEMMLAHTEALTAAVSSLVHPRHHTEGARGLAENIQDVLADRALRQHLEAVVTSAVPPDAGRAESLETPRLLTAGVAAPEALFGIPGLRVCPIRGVRRPFGNGTPAGLLWGRGG